MKPSEQRRFPRVNESFNVRCRPLDDFVSPWCEITMMNFSVRGMRVRGGDVLEPGTPILLEMRPPRLSETLTLKAQVAWSELISPGVAESGFELLEVTPDQHTLIDQLVTFLGHPSSGPLA